MRRHLPRVTRTLAVAALVCFTTFIACGALAGCGHSFLEALGFSGGVGGSGQPKPPAGGGILTSREELARLLEQLKWLFIGLGIVAFIASWFVPFISTRHSLGSIVVGVGIAIAKPFIIALYWPTVIALALAGVAAAWPYLLGIYTWVRTSITGGISRDELTTGWDSIRTLWRPRSVVLGNSTDPLGALRAGASDPSPPHDPDPAP